ERAASRGARNVVRTIAWHAEPPRANLPSPGQLFVPKPLPPGDPSRPDFGSSRVTCGGPRCDDGRDFAAEGGGGGASGVGLRPVALLRPVLRRTRIIEKARC